MALNRAGPCARARIDDALSPSPRRPFLDPLRQYASRDETRPVDLDGATSPDLLCGAAGSGGRAARLLRNAAAGDHVMVIDATKCMVHAPNTKLVVLQGLDDFIVVDTKDVLLICKKDKEQEIKEYVAEVKRNKGDKFL